MKVKVGDWVVFNDGRGGNRHNNTLTRNKVVRVIKHLKDDQYLVNISCTCLDPANCISIVVYVGNRPGFYRPLRKDELKRMTFRWNK